MPLELLLVQKISVPEKKSNEVILTKTLRYKS